MTPEEFERWTQIWRAYGELLEAISELDRLGAGDWVEDAVKRCHQPDRVYRA